MASPRLEIGYCAPRRWLLRAAWLAQELLTAFDADLGERRWRRARAASSRFAWTAS